MTNNSLCTDSLRHDHPSVPYNPLLAELLYLVCYIERVDSGTQTMIELCLEAGLPEPQFEQREGFFVTTTWRDWLTSEILAGLNLNERQVKAVSYLKTHGKISNKEYQQITNAITKTASRDLSDLKEKGIVEQVGIKGPGVHYVHARKGT